MTTWEERKFTANDLLLDRLLTDSRGVPAGRVDDLELSDPGPGRPPVLTALLSGPTAFGPRIGGRLGTWWLAIGRRLRPLQDPYPVRIPFDDVTGLDRRQLTVRHTGADYQTWRLRDWVYDKLISRIPGGAR